MFLDVNKGFLVLHQALVEIERLRRSVSRGGRSPSPSHAASAVLSRVEAERDHAVADLRRSQNQIDNLQDKLKVNSMITVTKEKNTFCG